MIFTTHTPEIDILLDKMMLGESLTKEEAKDLIVGLKVKGEESDVEKRAIIVLVTSILDNIIKYH